MTSPERAAPGPLAERRILVTGGSGFIGAHLVRWLRSAGATVIVADLVNSPDRDVVATLEDLRDPGAVARAMPPGVDTVVHLAAATSVLRSVDRPAETFSMNVAVTSALLEQARVTGVKTFVLASTNAVVGIAGRLPIDEHSELAPLTPYGATKAAAEMLLSAYNARYGLRCAWLRLTNVYGPGMGGKDSVIPRLLKAVRAGTVFEAYGDGRQLRDYIYVSDVVAAIALAIGGDGYGQRVAGPMVVGSGRSTSVLELITMVRDVTGLDVAVRHVAAKAGEMPKVVVDNSRARSLGWQPEVPIDLGLRLAWDTWPEAPVDRLRPSGARAGLSG